MISGVTMGLGKENSLESIFLLKKQTEYYGILREILGLENFTFEISFLFFDESMYCSR